MLGKKGLYWWANRISSGQRFFGPLQISYGTLANLTPPHPLNLHNVALKNCIIWIAALINKAEHDRKQSNTTKGAD